MQLLIFFGWLTACCAMCLLGCCGLLPGCCYAVTRMFWLVAMVLHAFCISVLLIVCFGMLSGSCYVFARVSCVVMLLLRCFGWFQGDMFGC